MTYHEQRDNSNDENDEELASNELVLWQPYSRITCFLLQLVSCSSDHFMYSLQEDLYKVSHEEMDYSLLYSLGPLARALNVITLGSQYFREEHDRFLPGLQKMKIQRSLSTSTHIIDGEETSIPPKKKSKFNLRTMT
jgi:hypothetical protein